MAATTEHVIRGARRISSATGGDLVRFRRKLDRAVRQVRKTADQGFNKTDRFVHKHPWPAVGIAAGAVALAGIVLATMVRNSRPRRSSLSSVLDEVRRAALSRVQSLRR